MARVKTACYVNVAYRRRIRRGLMAGWPTWPCRYLKT